MITVAERMKKNQEEALRRYVAYIRKIEKHTERIQAWVDDMGNVEPDAVHFGHVGTVAEIEGRLDEIVKVFIDEVDEL